MSDGVPAAVDDRDRRRRRVLAFAAVLSVHLLIVLALLLLIKPRLFTKPGDGAMVVTLLPNDAPPAPKAAQTVTRLSKAAVRTPTPIHPPPRARQPLPIIVISRADMAAGDISKIPSVAVTATADAGDSGAQPGDAPLAGGRGPGGEPLYKAEWVREPTHAELVTYMPHNVGEGSWGVIACRTIPHFHVEDCTELGESPPGSGLARGMRQAAWQFLIRPPRVGGKALVGAWVSIRYNIVGPGKADG